MPFGLKNAGATYQRLVNSMFMEHIGKIVEVYVDDMLIKSLATKDHVHYLSIIFSILTKYGMRLNPEKCIFEGESGKFLGFVSATGVSRLTLRKCKLSSTCTHQRHSSKYRA